MAAMRRVLMAVREGVVAGLRTALWLLSIMVPVSFAVFALNRSGVLPAVSRWVAPAFELFELPGASALVFLSSIFMSLYAAIAVMGELGVTLRETTILAVMTLIAHNFLVELPVLRSTGSSVARMLVLRLGAAALAGLIVSRLLDPALQELSAGFALPLGGATAVEAGHLAAFGRWAAQSGLLILRVSAIVIALMVGERLMQELGIARWLGRRLGPLVLVFGLPRETAFLWVISNTLGLAYGAGILRKEVASGLLSREHGDLLNHHMAVSHSLLEDTLLFAALGVPALWIVVPRLALATAAVWERRLELHVRQRRRSALPGGPRADRGGPDPTPAPGTSA